MAQPKPLDQVGLPAELMRQAIPPDNPQTPEKIALGEKLFFDGRLSADGTVACSTCHDPARAFTDGRATSIGIRSLQQGRRPAEPLSRRGYPAPRLNGTGDRRSRRVYGIADERAVRRTRDYGAGAPTRNRTNQPAAARHGAGLRPKTAAARATRPLIIAAVVNLPSFRQLSHLVSPAEHGHFARAAKDCHVTQSTLSASIKELQNVLQASLVDRTKHRVVLTPRGLEIVERARRILSEANDLVDAARVGSQPLSGALRVGVIPTVGPFLLPEVLSRLRRAYPALRLYLVEDLTARLVEDLHGGRLDIVLRALPHDDCKNLETLVLFRDSFAVALPSRHRLAAGNRSMRRQGWPRSRSTYSSANGSLGRKSRIPSSVSAEISSRR